MKNFQFAQIIREKPLLTSLIVNMLLKISVFQWLSMVTGNCKLCKLVRKAWNAIYELYLEYRVYFNNMSNQTVYPLNICYKAITTCASIYNIATVSNDYAILQSKVLITKIQFISMTLLYFTLADLVVYFKTLVTYTLCCVDQTEKPRKKLVVIGS